MIMNDNGDKKALKDLTEKLNQMVEDSKNKMERKMEEPRTPILKRLRKRKKSDMQSSKLDNWLIQKGVISPSPKKKKTPRLLPKLSTTTKQKQQGKSVKGQIENIVQNKVVSNNRSSPKCNTATSKQELVSPTGSSKYLKASKPKQPRKLDKLKAENGEKKKITSNKICLPKSRAKAKQFTLNSFVKKDNADTFKRNDSFDSVELPTFSNVTKKKPVKTSKLKEQKASFQKYGVILPTVDEILKDKKDLEYRRNKINCFNPLSEDSLELPISNEILQSPVKEKGLDCKHLSLDELTSDFNLTLSFLSDIVTEKINNNRHQKYFNENLKVLTMSSNDLTYNTSTVVFSYEQIDHLMGLLKQQFDPDDTRTKYFFQVLLPELCLKIFMKTYTMNLEEAVHYLSERPLID